MALDAFNYPTGAVTSGTTAPANVTQQAMYATLAEYNNSEIELYDTQSYSNGSPFLTMLTKFGRARNSGDFKSIGTSEDNLSNFPDIKWKEQDKENDIFVVNGAVAVGTAGANTQITLTSTVGLLAQQTLRNVRTNEQVHVVSVDSSTLVTVTRKTGSTPNVAMVVSDTLQLIGSAVVRGDANVGTTASPASNRSNYFQKFVQTLNIDDFDMMSNKILDPKTFIARIAANKNYQLRLDMERAALFGEQYAGTNASGKEYYQTEGLLAFARRGQAGDVSGSLTTRVLEETLSVCTEYMSPGNQTKIMLLGGKAKAAINALYTGRINVETIGDIKEQVETIQIGTGKFIIMQHPLMNAASGYEKHGLVVDPGYLKICYPSGVDLNGSTFDGKSRFEMDPTSTYANMTGSFVSYMGLKNVSANSAGIFKISA